jgi:hypothetical protein
MSLSCGGRETCSRADGRGRATSRRRRAWHTKLGEASAQQVTYKYAAILASGAVRPTPSSSAARASSIQQHTLTRASTNARRAEEMGGGEKDAGNGGCAQLFVTMCSVRFDTTRVSVLTKIPVQISNNNQDPDVLRCMESNVLPRPHVLASKHWQNSGSPLSARFVAARTTMCSQLRNLRSAD